MSDFQVWLVRHAETEWSRARRHTGHTDVPLTDAGREHARALRALLAHRDWARVLSSPLSRAWETCKLAGLGDRAQLRVELVEWDYGDYEGITTVEIRKRHPGWDLWTEGCPNGEMPADVGARVDRVIAELADVEGDAIVFAHGHVLRVLAARWLGLEPVWGGSLRLATGGMSVLGWERGRRAIERWNDVSSLNALATGGGDRARSASPRASDGSGTR